MSKPLIELIDRCPDCEGNGDAIIADIYEAHGVSYGRCTICKTVFCNQSGEWEVAASQEWDAKPKRGGLRTPAGGRPRKDNAVLHCYVPPFILAQIDQQRGALTRGEYITMLVAGAAIDRSNQG